MKIVGAYSVATLSSTVIQPSIYVEAYNSSWDAIIRDHVHARVDGHDHGQIHGTEGPDMGVLGIATGEDTTVLTMRLHLEVDVAKSVRLDGPDVTIAQAVSEAVVATGEEIARALETAGDTTGPTIVTETNIVAIVHEVDLKTDDITRDLTVAKFGMASNLANIIRGQFTGSEART